MRRKALYLRILSALAAIVALTVGAVAFAEAPVSEEALSGMSDEELARLVEMAQEEMDGRGEAEDAATYNDLDLMSKGEDVLRLQERLTELGFYSGRLTGKYDNETKRAMKQFEKTNGLKNDGKASQEDQRVLYSDGVMGKNGPLEQPAAPEEPARVEPETPVVYGELDYAALMQDPQAHVGEAVSFTGKAIQVLGSKETGYRLRVSVGEEAVYVSVDNAQVDIAEDDQLTVQGVVLGTKTYQAALGKALMVPSVSADNVIVEK